MRPPRTVVLRYRLFGRRPGTAYDPWLRADLDGRWFPLRYALSAAVVPLAAVLAGWWTAAQLGWGSQPAPGGVVAVAVLVVALELVRAVRREAIGRRLFGDQREVGHFQPYAHLEEDR